jgi:hypothetical protein
MLYCNACRYEKSIIVSVYEKHHSLNLGQSPAWKLTHEVQVFYVVGLSYRDLIKCIQNVVGILGRNT